MATHLRDIAPINYADLLEQGKPLSKEELLQRVRATGTEWVERLLNMVIFTEVTEDENGTILIL